MGRWRPSAVGRILLSSLLVACEPAVVAAAPSVVDLADLDLASLAQVEFTSADKQPSRWWGHAGAVSVVGLGEIRRSGATTIPEALRLVPGVSVGQASSNAWAVGVRGFTALLSSKLLVLVDGRSVYNPLFSGVYWENLELDLLSLDRIEVVRGAGGTVWGANAVNGVVNVVSAPADRTVGVALAAGLGSEGESWAAGRRGWRAGER